MLSPVGGCSTGAAAGGRYCEGGRAEVVCGVNGQDAVAAIPTGLGAAGDATGCAACESEKAARWAAMHDDIGQV